MSKSSSKSLPPSPRSSQFAPASQPAPDELDPSEGLDQVAVTVLLSGGQDYTITISPEDQLLQDLYEALMIPQEVPHRLFQLPIQGGRAGLTFPSHRLVGLITEPPLMLTSIESSRSESSTPVPSMPTPTPAAFDPLNSIYLQLDQFLSPEEHQQLLNYAIAQAERFVPTSTFTGENNYRESVVLYAFPKYADLIAQRIHGILPQVLSQFGLQPFQPSQIEAQLTAHNDRNYYKLHNDNGSPDTATRELTYVYYFYREPKPFSGGELIVYDSKIQNNYYVQANTFKTVEPRNNSIVFFLSRYMHEVLPIHCPSQAFVDSRFTINGWIRR